MVKNNLESRRQTYFNISSQIAGLDDVQLRSLFNDRELSSGWGINHTIVLGKSQVFVKRIPVTNFEYDNLFTTKNLYELPTYYNYGVGSAGFGVFRELITHIKTTTWVLAGSIATFPLMYHYRIVPFVGQRLDVDLARHEGYVKYWGNSANIGKYILERANANYELVLFLEYIPHVLDAWLRENPDRLQQSLDDLRKTIDFLRSKEIVHFDAHLHNILTDGERIYLTDFGLVLDKSFSLAKDEESFCDRHILYDSGEILWNLRYLIRDLYETCSEPDKHRIMAKYGIEEGLQSPELTSRLLDNIDRIHADGDLKLDKFYVASIVKYRSIIALMQDFYAGLRSNNQKNTQFPHAQLEILLAETGFFASVK
jgi:serine/threonine protein kinase